MKKFIIHCSVGVLLILLAATLCPAAEDMGLITGGEKGTYYQFGSAAVDWFLKERSR